MPPTIGTFFSYWQRGERGRASSAKAARIACAILLLGSPGVLAQGADDAAAATASGPKPAPVVQEAPRSGDSSSPVHPAPASDVPLATVPSTPKSPSTPTVVQAHKPIKRRWESPHPEMQDVRFLLPAGLGLAAAGASVYFALGARNAHEQLAAGKPSTYADANQMAATGSRDQILALSMAGASAVSFGFMIYYLRSVHSSRATIVPTRNGVAAVMTGELP